MNIAADRGGTAAGVIHGMWGRQTLPRRVRRTSNRTRGVESGAPDRWEPTGAVPPSARSSTSGGRRRPASRSGWPADGVPGRPGTAARGPGRPATQQAGRAAAGGLWGWAAQARPAWRSSMRTGIWPRSRCAGSSPPRTRRYWRQSSRCWPPAGRPRLVDPGIRWPAVHAVLAQASSRMAADVRQRAGSGRRSSRSCRRGPGRVLITTQNQHWPPGQALDVPVLDHGVAADFLVEPHR